MTTMLIAGSAAAWVTSDSSRANSWATGHWLQMALGPATGKKGSIIEIAGSGFAPDAVLTVRFGGHPTPWTSNGGTETSTTGGAIPAGATIKAGGLPAAVYVVTVTDAAGNSGSATFKLLN
ncbi:MAG TPA: hypothetical protein VFN68_05285 [Acidimicrobiales bacterium]|nr:hypothetical protein [Acidimicrobiales bacterium]